MTPTPSPASSGNAASSGAGTPITPAQQQQIFETDAKMTDVLYDYAVTCIGRSNEHFARIDNKATTLTSVLGVIITLLFTVGASVFPNRTFSGGFAGASQVLLILSAVLLFVSLGYCVGALWLRQTQDVPLIRQPLQDFRAASRAPGDEVRLKKGLIDSLSHVDDSYYGEAAKKAVRIRVATRWLTAGFVALAVGGLCFILDVSFTTYGRTGASTEQRTAAGRPIIFP